MQIVDFNDKPILVADMNETVSFTVCRGPDNCFTYEKKVFELSEKESQLIIAELIKEKSNE